MLLEPGYDREGRFKRSAAQKGVCLSKLMENQKHTVGGSALHYLCHQESQSDGSKPAPRFMSGGLSTSVISPPQKPGQTQFSTQDR
jgi:hypothetical protein